MYKIGDKLLCKKSGDQSLINLIEGKIYEISSIYDTGSGYYYINNFHFYSEIENKALCKKIIDENIRHNVTGSGITGSGITGSVGIGGISPSAKLEDYFYTKKEMRKLKLNKLYDLEK